MKKIQVLIILILISSNVFSQYIDGNKISQVYTVPGINANELFSKINFVISLIYKKPDDVIKYNDEESKIILIKAMALVPVLDVFKLMNPKNPDLSDYIDYRHDYDIIIRVKDEKYKIEMTYDDGKYIDKESTEYDLPFSTKMDYKKEDMNEIIESARDEISKSYYYDTSRRKKEIYIQSQPRIVLEYQKTLVDYSTIFFQSLYKGIFDETNQDDW